MNTNLQVLTSLLLDKLNRGKSLYKSVPHFTILVAQSMSKKHEFIHV